MTNIFVHSDPKVFRVAIAKEFSQMFIDTPFMGENIEKGIFNYSIKEATIRQIIKKWHNPLFCEIYSARLRTVLINLKQNTEMRNQ